MEHGYADNDGVTIHYVSLGEGPLVVMIHGFPDFWYTWRDLVTIPGASHFVQQDESELVTETMQWWLRR